MQLAVRIMQTPLFFWVDAESEALDVDVVCEPRNISCGRGRVGDGTVPDATTVTWALDGLSVDRGGRREANDGDAEFSTI